MTVFAQVIPVLIVAAFLSGVRIGQDRISRIVAEAFMISGAVAEATLLIFIAFSIPMDTLIASIIVLVTIYMLAAVVATAFVKLEQDHKQDRDRY